MSRFPSSLPRFQLCLHLIKAVSRLYTYSYHPCPLLSADDLSPYLTEEIKPSDENSVSKPTNTRHTGVHTHLCLFVLWQWLRWIWFCPRLISCTPLLSHILPTRVYSVSYSLCWLLFTIVYTWPSLSQLNDTLSLPLGLSQWLSHLFLSSLAASPPPTKTVLTKVTDDLLIVKSKRGAFLGLVLPDFSTDLTLFVLAFAFHSPISSSLSS